MPPLDGLGRRLTHIGPGIVLAATGVGAGDLVAASVAGARFGYTVAWAALLGALLKFALNEGLARWQLATGTTLLEGWATHLGRWFQVLFLAYLLIWSFVVAGALISACGIAAHALVPGLSVATWGVVHSLAGAAVVLFGSYAPFERMIKIFVGTMFVALVGCMLFVAPPQQTLALTVSQAAVPPGGVRLILGVIGGVGGSVTLLSYGYWIRERRWEGAGRLSLVRLDLAVAYLLTGLLGFAVIVLAAHVLNTSGIEVSGKSGVLRMAEMLEQPLGAPGRWTFLVGFWGAVTTSLFGVWNGVPYLFCDFVRLFRRLPDGDPRGRVHPRSPWYRAYLLFLSGPPLLFLFTDRPVALIVAYTIIGSLFMPFLAGSLLYLNSRVSQVARPLRNGWASILLILVCLALFGYLAAVELIRLVSPALS